jgi:hypothetical protein
MVRRVVNLATELRGHQRYYVDRRHELLDKRSEAQRVLQHAQLQLAAATDAVGSPLGGDRDASLARFEQKVADAQEALAHVQADIAAVDQQIDRVSRDAGEAAAVADRILEHKGLNEDLEPVMRLR